MSPFLLYHFFYHAHQSFAFLCADMQEKQEWFRVLSDCIARLHPRVKGAPESFRLSSFRIVRLFMRVDDRVIRTNKTLPDSVKWYRRTVGTVRLYGDYDSVRVTGSSVRVEGEPASDEPPVTSQP